MSRRSRKDLYEPVHTTAYNSASCLKFVFIQHLMIAGTAPNNSMPGAMPGASVGDRWALPRLNAAVSRLRLLARPEVADRMECAELARPSDLCEGVRSFMPIPPKALLVRDKSSTEGLEECEK